MIELLGWLFLLYIVVVFVIAGRWVYEIYQYPQLVRKMTENKISAQQAVNYIKEGNRAMTGNRKS